MNTYLGKVHTNVFFEIEILENPDDSDVFIGVCESQNFHNSRLPDKEGTTVICNGNTGVVSCGPKSRKYDFKMNFFGDIGGIFFYRDTEDPVDQVEVMPTCQGAFVSNLDEPDELRTQMDDVTSESKMNKKADLKPSEKKKLEKEKKKKEDKRRKARQKYKLYNKNDVDLYPFVACTGPCSFEISMGTRVFKKPK